MRVKRPQTKKPCKMMALYSGWIYGGVFVLIFFVVFVRTLDQRQSRKDVSPPRSSNRLRSLGGSLVHSDVTCEQAKDKVLTGEWPDPNQGRIFARETITEPHFRISLHEETYDPVRWRIMEEGKYYEDEVHKRFVSILKDEPTPSVVLDVGANIGYYTLLSVTLGHNVVSFEPNPANVLRLCDSLRLNDVIPGQTPEVHIFQNAVSDVHGESMMLHSPKNPGQAFLKPIADADEETNEHKAKTTLISLDKFAEEQGWFERRVSIKLLKVDVEGKEPQVFLGSPKLLASGLVEHILTEGRRFGRTNIQDSFVVMFDSGYIIKEPSIPVKGTTSREKAKSVCDWWLNKLGSNSQMVRDMWWVRAL